MNYSFAIEQLRRALGSLLILKKYNSKTKINLNARIHEIEQAIELLEKG